MSETESEDVDIISYNDEKISLDLRKNGIEIWTEINFRYLNIHIANSLKRKIIIYILRHKIFADDLFQHKCTK